MNEAASEPFVSFQGPVITLNQGRRRRKLSRLVFSWLAGWVVGFVGGRVASDQNNPSIFFFISIFNDKLDVLIPNGGLKIVSCH